MSKAKDRRGTCRSPWVIKDLSSPKLLCISVALLSLEII
jgi:hypothetical protein